MRIVFFGTADFGIPALRILHDRYDVAAVVTIPDRTQGRGRRLVPSPVRVAAEELGCEILMPDDLRDEGFLDRLNAIRADLFYVVAFRILPQEVFSLPPRGTVNLHGSLLPDYRGAAPINRAVINGDTETGLTTFFIEETVDAGDIIASAKVAIDPDETAGELAKRMRTVGAKLTLETVELLERGDVRGLKQPDRPARPAPKLFKSDGLIDWKFDARTIHNRVRGMNPIPGAFTVSARGNMKILRTRVISETGGGQPGVIESASPKEGLVVSCGTGILAVLEIQPPGKKAMDGASFVRGYRVEAGMNISEC